MDFNQFKEIRGNGNTFFQSTSEGCFFRFEDVASYKTDDSGVLVKMKDGNYTRIGSTDEAARFIDEHDDYLHNQNVLAVTALNSLEHIMEEMEKRKKK